DGVVLVEDGDDAEAEQPVPRGGGVEITAAVFEIVECYEHLRRGKPLGAERLGPDLTERDLPDRGGGLRILEAGAAALGQLEPPRAQRVRARGDDRDLLARTGAFGDIRRDPGQPFAPHAAVGIDEQRRADLDYQARAGGGGEEGHTKSPLPLAGEGWVRAWP